ncbi:MAG TPA: GcrA family cell cycle regulator [Phenylobacterium sp.]
MGDPKTEGFTFCGVGAIGDGPYCGKHAGVAYQPRTGRADDLVRALRRYFT